MMKLRVSEFRSALAARRVIKVIAGIANFDLNNILTVVRAASHAGAAAVDVAARPDIVEAVRKNTELTVFASCIQPQNLLKAVESGADVVELGNYDALYDEGLFFTGDEVLKLAEQTMQLVQSHALVSVTLPGHLSIDTQINMANRLAEMGVDMIQTEGASRALTAQPQIKPLTHQEKGSITLSNTRALVQAVSTPIMSASGIGLENIVQAFEAGASAVGVGSAVNKLATEADMIEVLVQMVSKVQSKSEAYSLVS